MAAEIAHPQKDCLSLEHVEAADHLSNFRPMSRSKTTYGNMTLWAKPNDLTPGARRQWADQSASFPGNRSDPYFERYLSLSSNVAHKHPNLSLPREREGRIGGSWRHIKEVLGYTGTQVCFVDGLVSLYDTEAKLRKREHAPMWKARLTGPTGYSANLARQSITPRIGQGLRTRADEPSDMKYKGFYTSRQ